MTPTSQHTFPAIGRGTVVTEILESFKQALIRGDVRPGQRLPTEAELADQLRVGRSAIREAMKVLEALGVVVIRRGNGTWVADSPSATVLSPLVFAVLLETGMTTELLEFRELMQVATCQMAAVKAGPEDFERIDAAAQRWEAYARSPERDVDRLTELDLDFHFTVLEATANPFVIRVGRVLEEMFFASIRETLSGMAGLEWGVEGHRKIVAALRSGDLEAIRAAVVESLAYWGTHLETAGQTTPEARVEEGSSAR